MTARPVLATLAALFVAIAPPTRAAERGDTTPGALDGQWKYYGGDPGSTKYSHLDQINATNVGRLKIAWSWDSPDIPLQKENRALGSFAYETTPLAVRGILYASTSIAQVAAIDGRTGEQLWVFNPEVYKAGRPTNLGYVHRGIAYWAGDGQERLYLAAHDAYLYCIDAKTGQLVSGFGEEGRVNLAKAIPRAVNARNFTMTSPPVICRNVVVVGSSISDGPQNKEAPRGDVQAFDVRTGKPAWTFHAIPQEGEFGNDTWENESWKYTGNANVWTLMSVDEELGYVYLPMSTPTNDWYGGHRLGDGLFAEALVCVEATSGKRMWHFQTVHHGLWDYDLPAAPVLCDIKVDGRPIKAVAQITKTGFTFVFDRVTGKPVWPIEERPVPQSSVPGERTSPTQPFPTKPAPYERQGATEDNLVDFTPEILEEAKKILDEYDHGPLFTPPTERGALNLPGWAGGANWWGAAFDPDTSMFYVPSITAAIIVKLNKPDAARSNFNFVRGGPAFAGGADGPKGLPLFKPPYGRITAIDLNTGEHAWMIPHGDGPRQKVSEIVGRDVGPLGSGGGGPLLTKTLLFFGQGAGGRGGRAGGAAHVFRAYDKASGKVIAELPLPAPPSGTPMTYMANGKQYIAVATNDQKIVAFSLPSE
ncbi:MAG: pyrroloquinoline quinone-dependent dehydrogenase [Planctomycetia bacterium]|nr:pyrroloquinoline quinone-dependent dehydrogenase [Planctomycetia bacterium]